MIEESGIASDDLFDRVEELKSATSGLEIVSFLNCLRVDNSKTGLAVTWNRVLKQLKTCGVLLSDYKPYSQLKVSEKSEIANRIKTIQEDSVVEELKTAVLEGFADTPVKYNKKRKSLKWLKNQIGQSVSISPDDSTISILSPLENSMIPMTSIGHQQQSSLEPSKKKYKSKSPSSSVVLLDSKETELLAEKIKSVRLERLQKAMQDTNSWNLLPVEVRNSVLTEYSNLLLQ